MTEHESVDRRGAARERELEGVLNDQANFIARLSEEMRSPLHAIQGLAEGLRTSETLGEDDRRHIESISKESMLLRRLVDDLLNMSKVGVGHMELLTDAFTPAALCDEISRGLSVQPGDEALRG